jgi:hypothetical protein
MPVEQETLPNGYTARFIANKKHMFDDDKKECLTNCSTTVRAGSSTSSAVHEVEAVGNAGGARTTRAFHVNSSGVTHLCSYAVHDDETRVELHDLEAPYRDETLLGEDIAQRESESANAGVVLFYIMEPSERGDFEGDLSRFEVRAFVDGEEVAQFEATEE